MYLLSVERGSVIVIALVFVFVFVFVNSEI